MLSNPSLRVSKFQILPSLFDNEIKKDVEIKSGTGNLTLTGFAPKVTITKKVKNDW